MFLDDLLDGQPIRVHLLNESIFEGINGGVHKACGTYWLHVLLNRGWQMIPMKIVTKIQEWR